MSDADGRETALPAESDSDVSLDAIPLHSTNLLTVLDGDGVVRYESPSIRRVFGYEPSDLVGEQVAGYFHPEDRDAVVGAFRAVVEGEQDTATAEYRHERADGTYCWVESITSADTTPGGYYVVNTRDISERKEREQRLMEANERLDEFAGALSHDLRNPLQVANGSLELAVEHDDCEYLETVARAHDRMQTLIDEVLALAHDGDAVGDPELVDLAATLDDCWRTVETGEATLVSATDSTIRAHRTRLRQLLENLFRNAVEHGSTSPRSQAREDAVEHGSTSPRSQAREDAVEHGGTGVTVTVGDFDDGFYVEDDGRGIDEHDREKVFTPGYTTGVGGGGLGLRIVEQAVEAHDWTMRVVDGSDGGARFEITGVDREGEQREPSE